MTITFSPKAPEGYENQLLSDLISYTNDDETGLRAGSAKQWGGQAGYKFNASVKLSGITAPVFMQAGPTNKAAFFRFEFNPFKLGKAGMAEFRKWMAYYLLLGEGAYETMIEKGRVTRIDIACDFVSLRIEDLIIRGTGGGKTHAYYGEDGLIQTSYLNLTKKNSDTIVYNKRQQLLDGKRNPKYGGNPHTRVEVQVKANRSPAKLLELENPLTRLELSLVTNVAPPEEQHHWDCFVDACRFRGVHNALKLIPVKMRGKYKAALKDGQGTVWQPQKLWEWWPNAIERSHLLAE